MKTLIAAALLGITLAQPASAMAMLLMGSLGDPQVVAEGQAFVDSLSSSIPHQSVIVPYAY